MRLFETRSSDVNIESSDTEYI